MSGIYLGRPGGRYHNSIVMDGARFRVINKLCSRQLVTRTLLVFCGKNIKNYFVQSKNVVILKFFDVKWLAG